MRILLVDDQRTTGLALSQILSGLGHDAHLVTSGAAAWDILVREDWRLIITDWIMPDVDGLELCRRVRGCQDAPYRYVIVLTVRDTRPDRFRALEAGADDFLTKPVDEEELVVRLTIAGRILGVQSELERKNARLAELANTDPLTGLANRRCLDTVAAGTLSSVDGLRPYSVVSLDIDHFKSYNDRFGHGAGDNVLRIVAQLLRQATRSEDLLVRVGGEEFVVILPGTGPDEAVAIAERMRKTIAEHPWPLRAITASFGVATSRSHVIARNHGVALEAADRALYLSKRAGRNRVTQWPPEGIAALAPLVTPELVAAR